MNGFLGILALVIMTLSFSLTCLFVPVLMSKYLGYKYALIMCQIGQFMYIMANFIPSYWTLMPTSFIAGIANAGSYIYTLL